MKQIETAIIGMGRMGKTRYEAMKAHGGFNIVSVCDIDQNCLKDYGCKLYNDWKQCINETKPEAIVICAVNNVIPDIVCFALESGVNVFSEKPPGRTLADAQRMKKAADKSGKILKFGFNHRYHNSVIEAKVLIESGLLGDIVCARGVYGKAGSETFAGEWRNQPEVSGGGILIDQGIHMLDLLCYFLGDFTSVSGTTDRLVWNEIPSEDSVFAILKTENGRIASLHSSALQWKHKFDLDIVCTKGYIALNGLLTSTKSYGEERISYYRKDLRALSGKVGNPIEHTMCFDSDQSWDYEAHEFFDAVRKGAPLKNGTAEDALRVMRLIENLYSGKSLC